VIVRITIIVMLFIAAVLAFAATKPKTFHLRRSIAIKAPPEKVFALVNDLHKWNDWSEDSKTGEVRSNRSAGGRHAVPGNPGEYSFGQRSRVRGGRAAEMTGGAGHRDAVHRTRESALGAVCD
jgi:Polyketide cyclase / dehydrase and lipid transport